jgi:hypothetical protein
VRYSNFKPLDMSKIQGGSHNLPSKAKSWLPRFSGEDNTTSNLHLTRFYEGFELHEAGNRHSDVIMKLFSALLIGIARIWYNNLPNKSIKTWEDFEMLS